MNTLLKWNLTPEQIAFSEQSVKLTNRATDSRKAEKEAKAQGKWDYRNNKIVEE